MAVQQVGNRQPDGLVFGVAATDAIGFYGATPVPQPAGASQAVTSSTVQGAGALYSVQSVSVTPSAVNANTTTSQALTCTGSPTNTADCIIYNKITAQAGLGIVNVLPGTTASTVVVQYCNVTGGNITPTAEAQTWASFRGSIIVKTVTLTPAAIVANTTAEQIFTVTGVSPAAIVHVSKPTNQSGLGIAGFRAAGNNQLAITFMNSSGSTITPTAGESYNYMQFDYPGLPSASSIVILGANVGTLSAVNATTAVEQAVTVTGGVLATDFALGGVSKPTAQANIGIVGVRVSAVNVLGITFVNPTATTTTPTGSEIYQVPLLRVTGEPPTVVVYQVALTPSAVAANTTAEQGFTVTGLAAQQIVWVNKPTTTPGLGIAGYRVSAANVLGITFVNATSAAITPPTETYLVGATAGYPSAGSYVARQVAPGFDLQSGAITKALASVGLIAGS
jgi:hypothetical protein